MNLELFREVTMFVSIMTIIAIYTYIVWIIAAEHTREKERE